MTVGINDDSRNLILNFLSNDLAYISAAEFSSEGLFAHIAISFFCYCKVDILFQERFLNF